MHRLAHIPDAPIFVHVVMLSVGQCSAELVHVLIADAVAVVYHVETVCAFVDKPNFYRASVPLEDCVFN
jgi:hypothetical protein